MTKALHLTPKQTAKKVLNLNDDPSILVKRSLSVFLGRTTTFSIGNLDVDKKVAINIVKLGAADAIKNEAKIYLKELKGDLRDAGVKVNRFSKGCLKSQNASESVFQ